MKSDQDNLAKEIALFRYGVIADLIHDPPGQRGLYEKLRAKAELDYKIPGSLRRRVAIETMRTWLRLYRKAGFDALLPKKRADLGQSRSLPQSVADLLITLKEERPALSVAMLIKMAREHDSLPPQTPLPPSTVARLLRRHGLMDRHGPDAKPVDRRRFSFEKAGELFMSDVMHGPAAYDGRRKRKTYLIAFIDDATRVIPYAAFAFSENTAAFLPVFKQAVIRRGVPKRLFVDNGAAYRSQHLEIVSAKLDVALIHARPRDAAAKGKQERWFRTVRLQLLPLLADSDLRSLEALNRRLWIYIEREYHQAPHRGLQGQTPLDVWAQRAHDVRYPGPDLDDLFLFEAYRKVRKDRTVSIDGHLYEAEAHLIGKSVKLRYDPALLGLKRPLVIESDGETTHAHLLDLHANCYVKRDRPGPDGIKYANSDSETDDV